MRKVAVAAFAVLALAALPCAEEEAVDLDSRVDALLARLARGDAAERASAAKEAGGATHWPASSRAVPLLVAALEDDDGSVREVAAGALASLGSRGAEEVAPFLAAAGTPDRAAFLEALGVILELGAFVTPRDVGIVVVDWPRAGAVLAALTDLDPDEDVLRTPYRAYALLGRRADRRFLADSEFEPDAVARTVGAALCVRGASLLPVDASRTVPASVLALTKDPHPLTRWAAVRTLARLRSSHPTAVEALRRTATDGTPQVAAAAKDALARLGVDPAAARVPTEGPGPAPAPGDGLDPPRAAIPPDASRPPLLADLQGGGRDPLGAARRWIALWGGLTESRRRDVASALPAMKGSDGTIATGALLVLVKAGTDAAGGAAQIAETLEALVAANPGLAPPSPGKPGGDPVRELLAQGAASLERFRQPYVLTTILGRTGAEGAAALPLLERLSGSPDPLLAYLAARSARKIRTAQGGR